MKRKIKLKVLLISFIATLLLISLSNTALAESVTIQYDGPVNYGYSTVGNFHVDGKRAFCMDHEKTSPTTGTYAETSIYTNENVIKCLYYGWEGAEVWSGFNGNSSYGIVATTLAIDHYVNGSNKTVAQDFIAFIDSVSTPKTSLNLSETYLKATIQGDKQVTNQVKVTGSTGISLKFSIPDDVTLVCDSGNWSRTGGQVEVTNGDIIHFEAPINKTGSWTSEQIANSYVYNAILSRTNDDSLQRIVRLGEKDPGTYTSITIKFEDTGILEVVKKDCKTGAILPNTTFDVKNSSGTVVGQITTDANGKGTLGKLVAGTYTLVETKVNSDYVLDSTPIVVEIKAGTTTTKEITNDKKKGGLKVIKVDKDNHKVTLGNVGFIVYSEEFGNYLKQNENDYEGVSEDKATVFRTNANGELTIENLRYGNYKIKEVETNEWYSLAEDTSFTIDKTEILNLTIENELKSGSIKVIKVDKDNHEVKLKDVKFDVYVDRNSNGLAERNEYVDTLITDENGEATTGKYTIRDYQHLILIETETNEGYVLDNTPRTVELKENQITTITFENKYITTKVNPHKEDRDTHKPLAGAEFDIYEDTNKNGKLDEEDKVVSHTITKEDGYSEDLTFGYGTYFVKETKAPEGYTLDHVISTFTVKTLNQKIEVNFADKIIENDVDITKKANNDSIKYGIKKDEGVPDTYFALYKVDENGKIIDFAKDKLGNYIGEKIVIDGKEYYAVVTDETGNIQVTVPYGKYLFKEIKSHDLFLNDSKDNIIDVLDDGKKVSLEFYDTAVNLELDISKTGINQAQPNDIIKYDFPSLINKSNVALDNFTWWDHLPSKYTKITKLYTGIWNEELSLKVYYKTNKQDYTQYGLEYSSLVNNCMDFETLGLNDESNEYITDIKIEFGTVKSGFTYIEAPFTFVKVDSDVKATDEWTNKTKLTGNYTDENGNVTELEDNDEHTTTTYAKELKVKTLPRTGSNLDIVTVVIRALAIITTGGILLALARKVSK